jgi:hypothetical protein
LPAETLSSAPEKRTPRSQKLTSGGVSRSVLTGWRPQGAGALTT